MTNALSAVVLCAGKGTRMKSDKAKVLHPILGRPLCAYPISRAFEVGAARVVAVVGHQADAVTQAVGQQFPGQQVLFALQKEQKGTADAVKSARAALQGHRDPVLILYGDTPLLRKETLDGLLAAHRQNKGKLALISLDVPNPPAYGRVVREHGKVVRIVEQKDCTPEQARITECNAGIYVVEADFLWRALEQIKPQNAQGEYYLTDLVELAAREGEVAVVSCELDETAGVNDKVDLASCAKVLQGRINARHMKAGVTLSDPATTFIADDVVIGTDTELGPMVSLHAGTHLGSRVSIGQGCVLTRTRVADGTEVKPYSVFEEAEVGQGCIIGPFARLRPGTQLAEGVHIGNFVETKKTRVGKGSKANHLAYLGDAEIGSGVNVGAGTITCNYDGKNKFQTVLEDGVFIGSDTQLVAPVRVGQGAFVAAGTTVTADVPPMSLALSRTPQVNKEGWVTKKREAEQAKASASKKVG